jgi:tRNA threonylcarbamoyladenosine biosynthesis protein TsaE
MRAEMMRTSRARARRARAPDAVGGHVVHVAVPAAREPRFQLRLGGRKVAIGDADLIEAEGLTPALDIPREPGTIELLSGRNGIVLHSPDLTPRLERFLPAEGDTLALGRALAGALAAGLVIYLSGDLGTGKTTLARGVLRGLGYAGRVKSPTFTLVEVYKFSNLCLYHFDFYRFSDPKEWQDAGLVECFGGDGVVLVEWSENASGLPPADLRIDLRVSGTGRTAEVHADTEAGRLCLEKVQTSGTT